MTGVQTCALPIFKYTSSMVAERIAEQQSYYDWSQEQVKAEQQLAGDRKSVV